MRRYAVQLGDLSLELQQLLLLHESAQGTDGAGRFYVAFYSHGFGVILLAMGHQGSPTAALTQEPEGVTWRATRTA